MCAWPSVTQRAISDQSEAIRLEPEAIDPHLNRGTAEEALALWDQAAADYNWILERQPDEAAALYNLGNVAGSLGIGLLHGSDLKRHRSLSQDGHGALQCCFGCVPNRRVGDIGKGIAPFDSPLPSC